MGVEHIRVKRQACWAVKSELVFNDGQAVRKKPHGTSSVGMRRNAIFWKSAGRCFFFTSVAAHEEYFHRILCVRVQVDVETVYVELA